MEWWKCGALNFFLDILQWHERLNLLMFEFRKKEFGRPPRPAATPGSNSVQNVMKNYKRRMNFTKRG